MSFAEFSDPEFDPASVELAPLPPRTGSGSSVPSLDGQPSTRIPDRERELGLANTARFRDWIIARNEARARGEAPPEEP